MARARAKVAPEQEGGQWPAYVVVRKPLSWLKPYERNARTHSDAQIAQLRGSLKKFGWTIPVLAREDGTIIAGHGRVEAAKREGLTECPVIVATGWSEEQCRAYALADNRIALNSGWDDEILGLEVADLSGLGMDLLEFGFAEKELRKLSAPSDGIEDPPESAHVEQYGVIIICANEADQASVYARLSGEGLQCKVVNT